MDVTVRTATGADVEAVLDACEWLFEPPGAVPPGWQRREAASRVSRALERDRTTVLLAEVPGRPGPAGICSASLDLESIRYGLRCWVEELAVDPELRSRGIGETLLGAARDWASERGATHLELDTGIARHRARSFYDRLEPDRETRCYGWNL